ncbi:ras guanine nucleotide exchange factor i-related [Anaeramoeba flamelloides]|uniref:Ras guanine nucleotide exchange factor i-related n=1 Tax=Anaeramoeba flamelloides TaxID=1746091 RepID=A0ABQ8XQ00_9EUKA|nr:ras guanine nucleotide exchange factor i-related [Anaeramoeba flamelloides]
MTNLNTNPKKIFKDPDLNQKKEDSNLNSSVTQNPQLIQKETILNSSQKTTTTKNEKKIEIEIENDPNNKTKEKKNYQKPISEMDLDEIKKEKTNWFAYVMNKNPNIKTLREQVFPLARSESFGRIFGAGKEQTKENLSRDIILQLIMQHLMAIGFRETTKSIEKEAKIKYEPHYLRDSRLQNLIRTAVKNVDFIWDQTINDYHNQINETSTGISLVEHFHSLGIEEQEDDIDELNSIWDDEEVNNIIYKENKENENSEIIAASLNKLVELLTHEKKRNVLYTKTFLMTYQSFTTPRKLLAKLIQRFHIPPEKEEIYKGRKKIIRLRVCNFLRFWITDYFEDFQPKLLPELIDFIDNSIRTANMTKMANNLKEIIERNLNENDESKENTYKTPPDPKLPKNIFSPKLNLFDVDEEEIARQLTLIEFKIYSKIKKLQKLQKSQESQKLVCGISQLTKLEKKKTYSHSIRFKKSMLSLIKNTQNHSNYTFG